MCRRRRKNVSLNCDKAIVRVCVYLSRKLFGVNVYTKREKEKKHEMIKPEKY